MKKILFIASALLLFTSVLYACTSPSNRDKTPRSATVQQETPTASAPDNVSREEAITIAYAAPELSGGQGVIMNGLIEGAEEKGWTVVSSSANYDAETQASQIDYFISLGVDAITVVPVDSSKICRSIQKALTAGIPLFTIDRAPLDCQVLLTVQSNNYLAGQQAGQAMLEFLTQKYGQPQGIVLELQGDLNQNVAQQRGAGFNDVLKEHPSIQVVSRRTDWRTVEFARITEEAANAQSIDGIYLQSDCLGINAVLSTLENLGKKFKRTQEGHIFITGVDGCPEALEAIQEGFADQSSSQPLPDFGLVLVDYIEKVLTGGRLEEGEVTREGASWSPARISRTETGLMLELATTSVTAENVFDAYLWGNKSR